MLSRPRLPKGLGGSAERAAWPSGRWPMPPRIATARNRSGPNVPGASGTTAGHKGRPDLLASVVPPFGGDQRLDLVGHRARPQFSGPTRKLSILDHPFRVLASSHAQVPAPTSNESSRGTPTRLPLASIEHTSRRSPEPCGLRLCDGRHSRTRSPSPYFQIYSSFGLGLNILPVPDLHRPLLPAHYPDAETLTQPPAPQRRC